MVDRKKPYPDDEPGGLAQAASVLERHREEIVSEFRKRLQERESTLLSGSHTTADQLEAQARAIIEDTARLIRKEESEAPWESEERLSETVGSSRARERVHPSESLQAVLELSEAALRVISQELPSGTSPKTVAQIASAFYRCAMERAMRASISYVERLLREVEESHAEERRRLGRELHDRVANSLAVVYQNVDLVEVLKDEDPTQAEEKLELIRETTWDALTSVRSLSAELRQSVGEDGLEAALSDLFPRLVPEDIHSSISARGDESIVPNYVKEELFQILREAIRNAVSYSGAGCIRVELLIDPAAIRAEVFDDGQSFDPQGEDLQPGTGIESMNERAYLLGGSFRLTPEQGRGTRVEVEVPLERRRW